MFHRVIVPLDGSPVAEQALAPAVEFARLAGATLHLVRVIDTSWITRYGIPDLPTSAQAVDSIFDAERNEARDYLNGVRERFSETGIPVTVEQREGRAADEIQAAANEGDLIAIGSHGRTGFSRWAMGSVAEDITRHAEHPVLLIRASPEVVEADDSEPLATSTNSNSDTR